MKSYEVTCPICGHKVIDKWYTEYGIGIVEEYQNCTHCNFTDDFAYGHYKTSFGNQEFNYTYALLDDNNAYTILIKKIHRAMFMARRNWRKGLRKKYKMT